MPDALEVEMATRQGSSLQGDDNLVVESRANTDETSTSGKGLITRDPGRGRRSFLLGETRELCRRNPGLLPIQVDCLAFNRVSAGL